MQGEEDVMSAVCEELVKLQQGQPKLHELFPPRSAQQVPHNVKTMQAVVLLLA